MYRHDPRLREPSPIKMHESVFIPICKTNMHINLELQDAEEMLRAIKCPTFSILLIISFYTLILL